MSFPVGIDPRFATTSFEVPRSEDAIVISRNRGPQELREPLPKKQRHLDEIPLCYPQNPLPPPTPLPNPPKKSLLFYKTRLCTNYKMGTCLNGSKCNFAHGIEDLREPAPNWQLYVEGEHGNKNEQQTIIRNRVCRIFYRGEKCPYGEKCTFFHLEPGKLEDGRGMHKGTQPMEAPMDQNRKEMLYSDNIVVVDSAKDRAEFQKVDIWKTRLCKKWEEAGHCPFGDKCHFAHGHAEVKYGNQMENSGAAPTIAPSNEPTSTTSSSSFTFKNRRLEKKGFLRGKFPTLISNIYADWIDEFSDPSPSANEPEQEPNNGGNDNM